MKTAIFKTTLLAVFICLSGCVQKNNKMSKTAAEILGNPEYLAISYGGYRTNSRNVQPTIKELKDDVKILAAMGIKILRTYNVQLQQAPNLLKAIKELKQEDSSFEMYVMLGAWIDCKNAWTGLPVDHNIESENNASEIDRAVALAKQYPNIVKVIAVGNEAMVKWAESYYVQPEVILKWVNHLQTLKKSGILSKDLWITSSDDFSSWGGGDTSYHNADLEKLINVVDYVSMHTYPFHNTHYNPQFWETPEEQQLLTPFEQTNVAMLRAKDFAINQYTAVKNYVNSLGVDKPIHIGETGWASISNEHYGEHGSRAADEYKQGLYYQHIREWTKANNIACFYFEAFDENWKDAANPEGSENHFGLINLKNEAKFPIWNLVEKGAFKNLQRNEKPITKTFNGDQEELLKGILSPNVEYQK